MHKGVRWSVVLLPVLLLPVIVSAQATQDQPRKKGKSALADTSNPAYAQTPVDLTANLTGKPAKPAGFVHPGILVNRAQLDEIKKRVAAGTEPQKSAFEALKASPLAALDYMPHPRATVECGSYSNPDFGCKDEQADSAGGVCACADVVHHGQRGVCEERDSDYECVVEHADGRAYECECFGAVFVDGVAVSAGGGDYSLHV